MIKEFPKEKSLEIYRLLRLGRRFEEKSIELGDQGEIPGSIHAGIGMEAIGLGISLALQKGDITRRTHRGHAAMIAEGADIKYMFAELFGRVTGTNKGKGGSMHIAGISGVLGSNCHMAAGVALAFKIRNEKRVAVGYFGDGAANQGPVHEAMNMAAIWSLPVVFVCENNLYAVSTSVKYSSLLENLSQRAKAYGFKGITVDGMDVVSVYKAAKELLEAARSGKGPSLLECKSYRFCCHSAGTSRLNLHYRSDEEVEKWKERCPIKLWSDKLINEKTCTADDLKIIDEKVEKEIEDAVDFARNSKFPDIEDAFKDMYATPYAGIPQKGWG